MPHVNSGKATGLIGSELCAARQREAAHDLGGRHRLLAGPLQLDEPHGAGAAGDSQLVVEHRARRTAALDNIGAQHLDALTLAFRPCLKPGAGKRRQSRG